MLRSSRQRKRLAVRIGFLAEALIFCWVYFLGPQGMRTVWHMRQENGIAQKMIKEVTQEVAQLEKEIVQWRTSAFYKEKYAREQLQMARAGEVIYVRE